MQFVIDKAMMNARVELANRIGTKIESLMRESLKEDLPKSYVILLAAQLSVDPHLRS